MAAVLALSPAVTMMASADRFERDDDTREQRPNVQLGPRPFYLVDKMEESRLKRSLQRCIDRRDIYQQSTFSIGHRGAPLQFPEHTKESYVAAARMGAGILECDVTFTKDRELVCRHALCDLHTTTNIVATDLASQCTVPPQFSPAGTLVNGPSIKCCTSDLTIAQFKSLCGKMDASNPQATTVEAFLGGTPHWRTDLYATCGTLLTHQESIALFKSLDAKMTPELKGNDSSATFQVNEVFGSQAAYAQAMIDDYKAAGINPKAVYAQSFDITDITYWIQNEPRFGKQAVYLVSEVPDTGPLTGVPQVINQHPPALDAFIAVKHMGVNIVAPPMPTLLTVDAGSIVSSEWAKRARAAGLAIITWTTERAGRINEEVLEGGNTFYYQSTLDALNSDGDILTTIDVLAQQVGVLGIFSDWPATTTFYANCTHPRRQADDGD
jgi:glycerophosphoryl diester phosphodiesterase